MNRKQPLFPRSLSEAPEGSFHTPLASWTDDSGKDGPYVGVADLPRLQCQRLERIDWQRLSVLISGVAGSGRTTVLAVIVRQFMSAFPMGHCVILDPTSTSPRAWTRLVTGAGSWIAAGPQPEAVGQLVEQIETLLVSPRSGQQVLVVLERLDYIASLVDDGIQSRLAMAIANGPMSGIYFVASTDSRSPLPKTLQMAFLNGYSFLDEAAFHGVARDDSHLVRMAWMDVDRALTTELPGIGLPLGHATETTWRGLDRSGLSSDDVLLGLDDLTHEAVALSALEDLVVFGSDHASRSRLLVALCKEVVDGGRKIGILSAEVSPCGEGTVDLLSEILRRRDDQAIRPAETLAEELGAVIEDSGVVLLVVFEQHRLARTLSRRGITSEPLMIADEIGRILQQRGGVLWASYASAPFSNSPFGGRHNLEVANHVHLDPKPDVLMGGYFSAGRSLLSARAGRVYEADEAVALIDGIRSELAFLAGSTRNESEIVSNQAK